MITVARVYLLAHVCIYRRNLQGHTLPGPHWRAVVSLVDTRKWSATPFREDLVKWVQRHTREKGRVELMAAQRVQVMVSTRSGLQTEVDADDGEDEEEEVVEEVTPGQWSRTWVSGSGDH